MPRGTKPEPTEPLHSLLDELASLRELLGGTVEMYDSFVRASEFGRNCQYSQKAALVFLSRDFLPIRDKIEKLSKLFSEFPAPPSAEKKE
jgi:hypothetical protein